MPLEPDFAAVQAQLAELLATRQSLILSTQDASGACELGVAPYVFDGESFALLLSALAPHTQHLAQYSVGHPSLKIMLLDDEADTRQMFARRRVSLSCQARRLPREDAESQRWFDRLEQRFGAMINLLQGLGDFHIHVLTPIDGRFIAGFGKAYRLEGLRVVEHLRG